MGIPQEQANWYVARLKSGEADRALADLHDHSIKHSYPMGNLRNGAQYPLIPGYVFVCLPASHEYWSFVKELRGIDRLLPVGSERPCAIPQREFELFHSRINSGEFDEIVATPIKVELPCFNKNERLLVTSGPFCGHIGIFVCVHKGLVILSLPFFGQSIKAPFKGHQVSKSN